jgi:hypothetical protein
MARADRAALDKPVPEIEKARTAVTDLEKRTAGGVEGEMDRRQAVYQKFGVDPVKMIAEERARHQEELKLSEEDYRKSQHLRYAQMFATFGSTPGPVLKAALVAINGVVPDLLDDKAKANAVRRDIKKAMFELDKSEYQEKKGNFDAASKSHEEAVGRITALNMELGKMVTETGLKKTQVTGGLAEREMAGMSAEKTAGISAGATIESARIRERAQERADIRREGIEERKEKERITRDTAAYERSLELNRKNSGYYDKKNDLEQRLAYTKEEKGKEELRKQLQNLTNEDRDQQDTLRMRYPDARVQEAAPKPAASEIKINDPKAAEYLDQYK